MSIKAEEQKWFHRDFEKSFGHLTKEQLPPIDWSKREHLEALFPLYKREQINAEKARGPQGSSTIEIEDFTMWTPTRDRLLFDNTELIIEKNKRCAVYGENGTGKTMLFHNIAIGEVAGFPKKLSVHHMQEMSLDPKADKVSVMETVLASHPLRRITLVMVEELTKLVASEADEAKKTAYEGNLSYLQRILTQMNSETAEERVSRTLKVLGFDKKGEESLMSSLSGGLRMRVALASAFFINPDLLLLDEPTNHLDLPSVLWLENQLRGYKGSFLVVTHDRHLLENVVTSVMQLQDQKVNPYPCGFAEFEKRRKKNDDQLETTIEKFLARNRNVDPCSPMYKKKLRYMKWMDLRAVRQVAMQGKFTFQAPSPLPGTTGLLPTDISLIKIDNVRFSYDAAKGLPFIFDTPISYHITMGTRVGIMGPNGAGKSTLLKLMTNKIVPTEGSITINPDFVLAYFGQHSTKELLMTETPFEFMMKSFPKAKPAEVRSHLERTSVDRNSMEKRMEGLSFSQRSCVIFAKLTFVPPHLLIMDEPTNFLDLDSVDALINAANKFATAGGALITVTHNRDFLKRTSKRFLSITPGSFREYGSMKEAERATYSFIDRLESGKHVDHKAAILENRGGGAIHTEEYLAAKAAGIAKLDAEKMSATELRIQAAKEAEEKEAAHAAKLAARKAAQKLDWDKDDKAWAPITTKRGKSCVTEWEHCTVVRNIRGVGVTIMRPNGETALTQPKKLKQENPEANRKAGGGGGGGKGGSKGGKGGKGGKGSSKKGGKGKGGGRGGKGKGGGRGGKGGGGRGGKGGRR